MVLELVEGPTLADCIASGSSPPEGERVGVRGGIPIDDALPIAKQIAEALEPRSGHARVRGGVRLGSKNTAGEEAGKGGASMKRFGLLLAFVLILAPAAQAQDAGQFFDSNGVQIHYVDQGRARLSSSSTPCSRRWRRGRALRSSVACSMPATE